MAETGFETGGGAARASAGTSANRLAAAISNVDPDIAESLCRKHVARHRSDEAAWRILISCIERNDNDREAVRMAEAMLAEFPASADVVAYVGSVLANHAEFERAHALLNRHEGELGAAGLLTLAQLGLLQDRKKAQRLFEKLAADYPDLVEARLGLVNAKTLGDRGARSVGFFLFSEWHRSIQQPVFDACLRAGLAAFMTTAPFVVRALGPPVLVVSDTPGLAKVRRQIPGIRIVHTRHGLGDKNYGYFAAGVADFVCVTSPGVADEYVTGGLFERDRFWVTGYPQLDSFFAGVKSGRRRVESKTVLFAPTFSKGLSAGLKLGAEAVTRIRGTDSSVRVIIRPHPHMRVTEPALLNQWRAQSVIMQNVEFNDDPNADIGELMLRSAVMVSDVSSIALSYFALDRPVICVDVAGEAGSSQNFAPEAIEWRMMKAADVTTPERLGETVAHALADQGRLAAERRQLRAFLFGELTDGHAGKRIADRIAALVRHA
jgi:hypothetical protein